MRENREKTSVDDLSLLKVEIKDIVKKRPPNERIISYILQNEDKDEF